jgi:antitoxin component YwqK of YwqJK toxin-antitoxin module
MIKVYRNGEVEEEHFHNGTFEEYWPDDIKRSVYTYKDGKKNGTFKEFYKMGEWKTEERLDKFGNKRKVQTIHGTQVKREGQFKKGKLDGEITTYSKNGKVKEQVTYDMGEPVG